MTTITFLRAKTKHEPLQRTIYEIVQPDINENDVEQI